MCILAIHFLYSKLGSSEMAMKMDQAQIYPHKNANKSC